MTFFLANAAGAFEDTRVGAVRLRVTIKGISTKSIKEIASSPLFPTVEALSIISAAFWSGGTLARHMPSFTTAALRQCY